MQNVSTGTIQQCSLSNGTVAVIHEDPQLTMKNLHYIHRLTHVTNGHTYTDAYSHMYAHSFASLAVPAGQGLLCKVKLASGLCLPAACGASHLHSMNTNAWNRVLTAITTKAGGV